MSKTTTKTQKTRLSVVKKHKILSILVLLVILVAVLLVRHSIELRRDKEKFEQARTSLDKVYAEIVATVGTPGASEEKQSCLYENREIGRGPLGCGGTY